MVLLKKNAQQLFQKNLTNGNRIYFFSNWSTVWYNADLEMCYIFVYTVMSSLSLMKLNYSDLSD